MAELGTKRFKDEDGNIFEINLSLNDAAVMDDNLEMIVTGSYREAGADIPVKAEFLIRLNPAENALEIYFENEARASIDLADLFDFDPDEFENLEGEEAWATIVGIMKDGGEALSAVIDSIPVPEPVFGCLLRAGISTATGQIVSCYMAFRQVENIRSRVAHVLRCLSVNSLVMLSKFTWRTFKCALGGGLVPL
jgi:hypothetical protein